MRKDGQSTKEKILEAAAKLFSENGFQDTTVSDICVYANTNIASVNYHFGSKESLYREVWKLAFDMSLKEYPIDGGLAEDAPAEDKLRAFVKAILFKILDGGKIGYYGKLFIIEAGDINPIIQDLKSEHIAIIRRRLRSILSELLGPRASEDDIGLCHFSVINQCLALAFKLSILNSRKIQDGNTQLFKDFPMPFHKWTLPENIDQLAEHITDFSLAGISQVRNRLEKSQPKSSTSFARAAKG
ncbi:Intercellular adhesion protein R [Limihaloglobus sulfuriphilus]|uniref:Intercellular adhesion protein R n=1 Tax=Limihaloglobus sulfuriphilus TaxID=1851148 RepID=A0A1Q2MH20_9BACT|nr:CerR family C-terminal domain-containing protein [Limihaloglobus sulfuriphilus]AQQ71562.1 Intercellular adhesion protein R [Limihaloglobus sulfuriphilus]